LVLRDHKGETQPFISDEKKHIKIPGNCAIGYLPGHRSIILPVQSKSLFVNYF